MGSDAPVPYVGLFITCLLDAMRPSIGRASVRLLERAGCRVDVPRQGCCGQIAFNSGDLSGARALALRVLDTFSSFDYVVAPSGSCAAMIRCHIPELVSDDPHRYAQATALAARTFELTQFLTDIRELVSLEARFSGSVTYHDSCTGLRELGIYAQPRKLLRMIEGLELVEMTDADVCCGFGGLFSVKFAEVAGAMAGKKLAHATSGAPDLILAGDLGCVLHLASFMYPRAEPVPIRHIAELLGDEMTDPPLGVPPPSAVPSPGIRGVD